MGTNYYAHIIPTRERRDEIKRLVDENDFDKLKDLVHETYGKRDKYNVNGGTVHLGKKSGGWKFLWDTNQFIVDEGEYNIKEKEWIPKKVLHKAYDLTKQSIMDFCRRQDVEIYNEYREKLTPEEFFEEAFDDDSLWYGEPKLDSLMYYQKLDEKGCNDDTDAYYMYRSNNKETQMKWEELGFKFEKPWQSDFYSDGLRFSIFEDFS